MATTAPPSGLRRRLAVNRVLVAQTRRTDFVEAATELTHNLRIGNGLAEGIQYGPVFSDAVAGKTFQHIDDAMKRGARLVTGGQAAAR